MRKKSHHEFDTIAGHLDCVLDKLIATMFFLWIRTQTYTQAARHVFQCISGAVWFGAYLCGIVLRFCFRSRAFFELKRAKPNADKKHNHNGVNVNRHSSRSREKNQLTNYNKFYPALCVSATLLRTFNELAATDSFRWRTHFIQMLETLLNRYSITWTESAFNEYIRLEEHFFLNKGKIAMLFLSEMVCEQWKARNEHSQPMVMCGCGGKLKYN